MKLDEKDEKLVINENEDIVNDFINKLEKIHIQKE
jgi:hypothetical protein